MAKNNKRDVRSVNILTQNRTEEDFKLQESQLAALEHLRKKSQGVKTINEVVTADQISVRDDIFDKPKPASIRGEDKEEMNTTGKVITEEDLIAESKEAENIAEKERIAYKEAFDSQIETWASHTNEAEDYKNFEFEFDEYLVRLFKMDISEFDGFYEYEHYVSSLQGNRVAMRQKKATDNIQPLIKILKVGKGVGKKEGEPMYKVGDIMAVPSRDVIGQQLSPEFRQFMDNQNAQGMTPIIPEGYRQYIPNVEVNWKQYSFMRPWLVEPEEIDYITFLLPSPKLRAIYNVKKCNK